MAAYALACGLPPLLVAAAGEKMRQATREPASLPDYVKTRHGPVAAGLTILIALFNQSVVLLAELVVIGSIFADFVGGPWRVIVVVVAVLTTGEQKRRIGVCDTSRQEPRSSHTHTHHPSAYTSVGGLLASIATDQVQGVASILVALALVSYVAATHAGALPRPLPPPLAPSAAGGLSFFTLGASLIASLAFQEGMWQRCWAAASTRALRGGAAMGAALTTAVVFGAGWAGVLAIGGNLIQPTTNPNLYLFELLSPSAGRPSAPRAAVGVVVVLLALTMNESAVDTLQNGMTASLAIALKGRPLWVTRAAVVAINVPVAAIALATPATSVLALFLVTNLLCSCALPPLACTLFRSPAFSEAGFVAGVVTGALSLSALGIGLQRSFGAGLRWAWYGNEYDWRAFAVALGASTVATLAVAGARAAVGAGRGDAADAADAPKPAQGVDGSAASAKA